MSIDILSLDFESFFSTEYSLKKMTTAEYIHDERFEAVMCGFKLNDEPTHIAVGEDIKKAFDFYKGVKYGCAHNAMFDGAIAAWRYKWLPTGYIDTAGLARAQLRLSSNSLASVAEHLNLAGKLEMPPSFKGKHLADLTKAELDSLATYCKRDTDLCRSIFNRLIKGVPDFEITLMAWIVNAFIRPVLLVDIKTLKEYIKEIADNREKTLKEAGISLAEIMSNPKFALALQNLGVNPPRKISPRTGKETWAFSKKDKGLLDLLQHPNVSVQTVVSARLDLKSTIEETRSQRLINIGMKCPLSVPLRYGGAHTGRLSGTDGINLQNLPRGSKIRHGIMAPNNCKIIVGDSSQIEARILAMLAEQEDLVDLFKRGDDPYCDMASFIYGRPITKADERERWVGKCTILGAGYSMSAKTFKTYLEVQGQPLDDATCRLAINAYRKKNNRIVKLWEELDRCLAYIPRDIKSTYSKGGLNLHFGNYEVVLPQGVPLRYPHLRRSGGRWCYDATEKEINGIYGGKLTENIVQALARHVVMEQLIEVHQVYPVALTVHDEIVAVAPAAEEEKAKNLILKIMSTPPQWWKTLPVKAEVKSGQTYGQAKGN